jgi:hypothetical protein
MEEKIKQKNPKLHKYLFTVTTFSKTLALSMLIIFPIIGFFLGIQYQKTTQNNIPYSQSILIPEVTPKLIGGDKDKHGCLTGAGYSWCEVKNKCLRVWEESCQATPSASEEK